MTPEIAAHGPMTRTRDQARRYFNAVHGPDWVFKAPEQFSNLVERWIWALQSGDLDFAETIMAGIETMAAEADQ